MSATASGQAYQMNNVLSATPVPTNPCTILEAQDKVIGEFYVIQDRRTAG